MKKIDFTSFVLILTLTTTSLYASVSSCSPKDEAEDSTAVARLLPIDILAAEKPTEAVKIGQTQHDLSEHLKIAIASAIKAHYPFLATQLGTLRTLGVDPAETCRPLLVKAYNENDFLKADLESCPVVGFTYTTSNYKNELTTLLIEALEKKDFQVEFLNSIPERALRLNVYQEIEAHIKARFEEFVVMVVGSSLEAEK